LCSEENGSVISLQMTQTSGAARRVTIIGAGIIGISTAAFLQRRGFEVVVIDRLPPGRGCSYGNAGGIAFAEIMPPFRAGMLLKVPGWLLDPLGPLTIRWSYLPRVLPWLLAAGRNALPKRAKAICEARAALSLRAVNDLETLLKSAGASNLLQHRDTLRLFDSEQQFEAEATERRTKQAYGYEMKRLSGNEVREVEPAVSPHVPCGAFHGGWYFVTNPERVVASIAADTVRNGGTILTDEVTRIECNGSQASHLELKTGGRHAVDLLVICAGAYSRQLTEQLGERVLLESERGYHLELPEPGVELSRSLTYARTPGAVTPMETGLRLAGTDEFAGLDGEPNWARADVLWKVFKRVLPGLREPGADARRWMGHRPGTPDSLPVIARATHFANVWYGFGHGHMGLTWGPTTGRLISEILLGSKSNIDLSPFRADRFDGQYLDFSGRGRRRVAHGTAEKSPGERS
jgi:D-amino-acid dehydrogenase